MGQKVKCFHCKRMVTLSRHDFDRCRDNVARRRQRARDEAARRRAEKKQRKAVEQAQDK